MSIPLFFEAGPLGPSDLRRFSTLFVKTAFDFFPCETVELAPLERADRQGEFAAELAQIGKSRLPLVKADRLELFLPVWGGELLCGLLVIKGGEEGLYAMPEVWLDEQSHIISREFYLLKQSCHDPLTGLVNGFHLLKELEILLSGSREPASSALALLEICPRSRDTEKGIRYIARASGCLVSMLGENADLHHLGSGIFAFIWPGMDLAHARPQGDALMLRLRRENFVAAHLGLTVIRRGKAIKSLSPGQILDQAWQALSSARDRGPFGLCAQAGGRDADPQPFERISGQALRKLRGLYRGKNIFSLALLRMDQEPVSSHFSKRLKTLLGQDKGLILLNQREAFLFLDGMSTEAARLWLNEFQGKMEATGGSTFSIGLASFPFGDFKKSALAMNCRKALRHASFFGPRALVVFDAVSLNISGDVYYNQGDLPRAISEYRQGLLLDPANVNILNSMGVASSQLNRLRAARDFFVRALALEPENFMALFNLGFICLEGGEADKAISLWERALTVEKDNQDLLQQLGVLYCRKKRHGEARDLLERCARLIGRKPERGGEPLVVARWLGRACEALGDKAKAIAAYQKALAGNPRDAGSLSRLGRLYAQEGQGQEIALSLCAKAVELDGGKASNWFRLGQVQLMAGDQAAAGHSFSESLRLDPRQSEAALHLGGIYLRQNKTGRARRLYQKILRHFPEHAGAKKALAALS